MAGIARPRCVKCNKFYKFNWSDDSFSPNCECLKVKYVDIAAQISNDEREHNGKNVT